MNFCDGSASARTEHRSLAEALERLWLLKVVMFFSEKGALRPLNLVPLLPFAERKRASKEMMLCPGRD